MAWINPPLSRRNNYCWSKKIFSLKKKYFGSRNLEKIGFKWETNTKFFHNVSRIRRSINRISKLEFQHNFLIQDPKEIRKWIVSFVSKLFNDYTSSDLNDQKKLIPLIWKIISEDQNKNLNERLTLEEVTIALNQLPSGKSLGQNGFPTGFFKKCWKIIGLDLVEAPKFARRSGNLLKEINNKLIALISKK